MKKLKIAVLASGGATDMEPIAVAIEKGKLNAEITVLICDKPEAYALTRAEKHHIPAIYLSPKNKSRKEFHERVMEVLEEYGSDLILFIGYMMLASSEFVNINERKTWNVHPALLPMFAGGMDRAVHLEILKRGAKKTGATLMYIDDGADTGPIIDEEVVDVFFNDTVDTLRERVQAAEQRLLIKYIPLFAAGKLKVETNAYGGKYVRILE